MPGTGCGRNFYKEELVVVEGATLFLRYQRVINNVYFFNK